MYHRDLEYYIKKFRVDLQEAVFDKEVFCGELGNQKLKVAKLEEQNLEIPEIRLELKDRRTWFMPRMLKPRSLECNSKILKDVTRDFTSTDLKKPSET